LKNHQNLIVFIIPIMINFTSLHIENVLFITILPFVDITVGEYFLKTEKHPHFCRHCYPFRTYLTIQIWTAYSMILLLLHKFYTQNKRDLILQMYLFYYLIQTPNFEYSFAYILLLYKTNVESTLYT
jgi:hypothetical protein